MLTVRQIFDDLLGTLGVDNPDTSSDTLRKSVLGYITSGLQLMQVAGEDFYCRENLDLDLTPNTESYLLASNVQTVLTPVRIASNKQPLKLLTSRSEYQDFYPLFLGLKERTYSAQTPIAYFVETTRSPAFAPSTETGNLTISGAGSANANGTYIRTGTYSLHPFYVHSTNPYYAIFKYNLGSTATWGIWNLLNGSTLYRATITADTPDLESAWSNVSGSYPMPTVTAEMSAQTGEKDPVSITIFVVPPPNGEMTITVPVIKEAPTYTADDLCGTSPVPPVPHKYHESILLPLCRMNVTTSPHFARHKDKLPQIQADYLRALTVLGLADPRKPKPDDSNSNRLKAIATPQQQGGQQ
jgi:hypothetical protein